MERVWYIRVEKEAEGPFAVDELKMDPRITLRTLAWKRGMPLWLPIAAIPELAKALFDKEEAEVKSGNDAVLTLDQELLPPNLLWILLAILLLILFFYLL